MTTEEKASRYDETLEKARNWHIDCQLSFKKALDELFPELDDKDERIRKAPEKIYLQPSTIGQLPHQNFVYTRPLSDESVEYIQTDVIIEKVVGFIKDNIELDKYKSPDEESYRMGWGIDYFETNIFIEDFKNYMKG